MLNSNRCVRTAVASLAAVALFAAGCAGIDPGARKMLQDPPNCAGASQDIRTLEDARQGGLKRFTQGLQGVAPPMVILSLLRDIFIGKPYRSIYLDHWRVAFGSYNRKIEERVEELNACR